MRRVDATPHAYNHAKEKQSSPSRPSPSAHKENNGKTPPKVMVSLHDPQKEVRVSPPKVVVSLNDLEVAAGVSPPKVKLSLFALEELQSMQIQDKEGKEDKVDKDKDKEHKDEKEQEWEQTWSDGLDSLQITSSPPSSTTSLPSPTSSSPSSSSSTPSNHASKTRGRGARKYLNNDADFDDNTTVSNDEEEPLPLNILEIFNIPPSSVTGDVEQYLECYKGMVKIKWVNDTTALAVFRSPSTASEALLQLSHASMKVRTLNDSPSEVKAKALSLSSTSSSSFIPEDSHTPRPKTTATVARRMIANALQISNKEISGSSKEIDRLHEARRSIWTDEKL